MHIVNALSGGDKRSIGRANEVVSHVLANPSALTDLISALDADDVVRMRAFDVMEKISVTHPEWLTAYSERILQLGEECAAPDVGWHTAQILPRLTLSTDAQDRAIALLFSYLDGKSRIQRSFALTGLVDFAKREPAIQNRVLAALKRAQHSGIASLEARARQLLRQFS